MAGSENTIHSLGRAPTHETILREKKQQLDRLKEIISRLRSDGRSKTRPASSQASDQASWARGL